MLPQQHRVRTPADFSQTLRSGSRSGRRNVVVSIYIPEQLEEAPVRAGFIVSKAVGNAVIRNKVKRRMRAIIAELIKDQTSLLNQYPGTSVVIRALPAASGADWDQLNHEIRAATQTALEKNPVHRRSSSHAGSNDNG